METNSQTSSDLSADWESENTGAEIRSTRKVSFCRYAEVVGAALDHRLFSNVHSSRIAIPNGMDPPEHGKYRALVERFFSANDLQRFRNPLGHIAHEVWNKALALTPIEIMEDFALPFAAAAQCTYVGWPEGIGVRLLDWMRRQNEAARAEERSALDGLAQEFAEIVRQQLDLRRRPNRQEPDLTDRLMHEEVEGRRLDDYEIVSILRNWTVGELATMAAAVGIVVGFLAENHQIQRRLRARPEDLSYAIDECLRLQGPLYGSRRTVTTSEDFLGRQIRAGDRVTLRWDEANRDPSVFKSPEEFAWDRPSKLSLLYGKGIHFCPGAALARLELSTAIQTLLEKSTSFSSGSQRPQGALAPSMGWCKFWITVQLPPDTPP